MHNKAPSKDSEYTSRMCQDMHLLAIGCSISSSVVLNHLSILDSVVLTCVRYVSVEDTTHT